MTGSRHARLRLALLALGLCCASACAGLIEPRFADRLRETGIRAKATVLAIEPTGLLVNDQPRVEILLRVEPDGASMFQASTRRVVLVTQLPRVQPGRVVTVRYDPRNRERVIIEALGHVSVAERADSHRSALASDELFEELNRPGGGLSVAGLVLSVEPTDMGVDGTGVLAVIRVKVLPEDAPAFDASVTAVIPRERLGLYRCGREIRLRYHPDDPTRVHLEDEQ